MRKIWLFMLIIISCITPVFANYWLNLEQFLTTYVDVVLKDITIPDSYRYIQLKYPNVSGWTKLYQTLQKAIYLDLFPNARIDLPFDKKITQEQAMNIISSSFDVDVFADKKQPITIDWLVEVLVQVQEVKTQNKFLESYQKLQNNDITNNPLFLDVYKKIQENYLSESWLLHGSIKWLVDWLHDPYTSFFPPTEATSFSEEMQGEYYGVGAYVEMNKPWELIITSPMKWSPAEKIGLLGGDRVVQINDVFVDKDMSVYTATSLIKWPAGTTVKLKILRDGKLLDFLVIRQKIIIQNIDFTLYEKWDQNICSISITMFDLWVAQKFQKIMAELSNKTCNKYIFDVRNNPGWSLDEVVRMLNYFVPNDETIVVVKSRFITEEIISRDTSFGKFQKAPVRILINEWSASASEIFAWVIKDYLKDTLLVWQKTFGKWSVQELVNYPDESMLKYTIAKRYTGKSKINIDKNWILPDKIISDKKETSEDEVLERAILN